MSLACLSPLCRSSPGGGNGIKVQLNLLSLPSPLPCRHIMVSFESSSSPHKTRSSLSTPHVVGHDAPITPCHQALANSGSPASGSSLTMPTPPTTPTSSSRKSAGKHRAATTLSKSSQEALEQPANADEVDTFLIRSHPF